MTTSQMIVNAGAAGRGLGEGVVDLSLLEEGDRLSALSSAGLLKLPSASYQGL